MRPRSGPARTFPALALTGLLLAAAAPAHAVLRPPDADPMHDTLVLLPDEARDFRFRRLAGADLHRAGLYLGLAMPGLVYATALALEGVDPEDGWLFLGYAGLPAAAAVMAAGNRVYAGAARYHPERDYPITRSLLPVAAFALAAGKTFWWIAREDGGEASPLEIGLLVGFGLTELLTLPALRAQYNAASAFLEQVEIRVSGQGPRVGLRMEF